MPDQNTTSPAVDVTALVAELERAWAPPPPPPVRGEDDEDDVWEGDDCGCGGEDGYGRPICNCGDGCSCESCSYHQHARTKTCAWRSAPYPAGEVCTKPTRYLVRGWHPDGQTSVQAKYVNPALDGSPDGEEHIAFDERTRDTSFTATACSQHHAYELAAELRASYNGRQPDPAKHYRFKIEQYRYEPVDRDLPDILAEIRNLAHGLDYDAEQLAKAGCRVKDTARSAVLAPSFSLTEARRCAAQLITRLAELDIREQPPRRWRAGDPLPDDVWSVKHTDGDTVTVYDRLTEKDGMWSSWNRAVLRRFESWEQMLAELGEVTGWPRHELIVPGEPLAADHDD